jgi:ubiquinone biosynthesis accessory factor UbiJ
LSTTEPVWLLRARGFIEAVMARLIATDDAALAGLAALEGRIIGVHLTGLGARFFLRPVAGRLTLHTESTTPADVEITAAPSGLLQMALALRRGEPPPAGAVKISGDLAVAQRFQAWLGSLSIDFEELLSTWWGDLPARTVVRTATAIGTELKRGGDAWVRATSDYLQHEAELVPTRAEVAEYLDAVDALREQHDRLAQRIERLAERLRRAESGPSVSGS